MSILVTGGAGRVGRQVIPRLLARGESVVNLDLQPNRQVHEKLTNVVGAFDDVQAVERAFENVDAVLHLGAFMSWLTSDAPRVYANVTGTQMLLAQAARKRIRRFVFASSGEVYPETRPHYLPIDEGHPTEPTSLYGVSKLLGEELVHFYQRTGAFDTVILRFSHTQDAAELLDPDSFFSGPRFYLRSKIRQQQGFGNRRAVDLLTACDHGADEKLYVARGEDGTVYRMPITDTRDLVEGILRALDSPRAAGQTMNLGTEEAIAFDHAVALLQQATGLDVVEVCLPGAAMNYSTSRSRAIELLDYRPVWTFEKMVLDAVAARTAHTRK